jgi:hypothetical protein
MRKVAGRTFGASSARPLPNRLTLSRPRHSSSTDVLLWVGGNFTDSSREEIELPYKFRNCGKSRG